MNFAEATYSIHPKTYEHDNRIFKIGSKSAMGITSLEGYGFLQVGSFSAISWGCIFEFGLNDDHNHNNVSLYGLTHLDWSVPKNFYSKYSSSEAKIYIGSDVWIGRGCRFKASNPNKPLTIGNGAIVASDSVVVKDVPPFAIVGGNPAKFIKWRFEPDIIEALERIAWWNWDLEKIYDNFHLFNNPKEFVKKFDLQR